MANIIISKPKINWIIEGQKKAKNKFVEKKEYFIESGENYLSLKCSKNYYSLPDSSKRGQITEFSEKSRRNFQKFLNSYPLAMNKFFITLTYPDKYTLDNRKIKEHLHSFFKRLQYYLGDEFALVWKFEFQKRGAPHFHCILVSDKEIKKRLIPLISRAWYEVVGSGDIRHLKAGTQVKKVDIRKNLKGYLSKYVLKREKQPFPFWTGRFWGCYGRKWLSQFIGRVFFKVDRKINLLFCRFYRRWLKSKGIIKKNIFGFFTSFNKNFYYPVFKYLYDTFPDLFYSYNPVNCF